MNRKLSAKTFVISQIVILLLGLTFAGILYRILNKDSQKISLENYTPVTTKPISFNLDVNNPEDELLTFDKTVVVSGKTSPKATIIISSHQGPIGLEADTKGEFSTVVSLNPNVNNLQISAFDEFGNTETESRMIFYSEEKYEE